MEDFWKYIGFVAILFLVLGLISIFRNCSFKIDSDELWYEAVDIGDGTQVYVYHNDKCKKNKPLFANTIKMVEYKKHKYDVFDFCLLGEDDLEMMSAISRRNIKDYLENAEIFIEDENDLRRYERECEVLDTLPCDNMTKYALK